MTVAAASTGPVALAGDIRRAGAAPDDASVRPAAVPGSVQAALTLLLPRLGSPSATSSPHGFRAGPQTRLPESGETAWGTGRFANPVPAYDLRPLSRVTTPKDQGANGTCWAFATIGSVESNLRRIEPSAIWDLSEDNVIWNAGLFPGMDPYSSGGNSHMALAYMARWAGPVTEVEDPYADAQHPAGLAPSKHLQEALFVPSRTSSSDNGHIKAAVQNYGAVVVDLYVGPSMETSRYWNQATKAYCYTGTAGPDHEVAIVGWDDGYSRDNFNALSKPATDGAFIVRNSWGSTWGDGGYFYVSYCDARIGKSAYNLVFNGVETTANYTGVFQHDPLGYTGSYGYQAPTAWFANVFTPDTTANVAAVSFYTRAPGSSYQLFAGSSLGAMQAKGSGTLAGAGYHTVTLTPQYTASAGRKFVVAVRLTSPGNDYPIAIEMRAQMGGDVYAAPTAAAGQSYVSANGTSWEDLTTADADTATANVCLKAFTTTGAIIDASPPITTSDAPGGWSRKAVTVRLTAADDEGGSGVAWTRYSVDGRPWVTGSALTVKPAASGRQDGTHTIAFQSADQVGNVESVKSCKVRIDTRRPRTRALKPVVVHRGRTMRCYFRVLDARPNSGKALAQVRICKGKSRGRVLLRSQTARVDLNDKYYYVTRCALPAGRYRYWVYATDLAGNPQREIGWASVVVKR